MTAFLPWVQGRDPNDIPPRRRKEVSETFDALLARIPIGADVEAPGVFKGVETLVRQAPDDDDADRSDTLQQSYPETAVTRKLAGDLTTNDLAVLVAVYNFSRGSAAGLKQFEAWRYPDENIGSSVAHIWRLIGPFAARMSTKRPIHHERLEPDWTDPKHVLQILGVVARLPNPEDVVALYDEVLAHPEPLDPFGKQSHKRPILTADMLPPIIARYATDSADLIGVDLAMVAMPCLVTAATACKDHVRCQPKEHDTNFTTAPRLWVAGIAPPSAGKTPALDVATKPLEAVEARWAVDDNQRIDQWRAKFARWKKDNAKHDCGAEPKKPRKRQAIAQDSTTEGIIDLLAQNEGGAMVKFDELSGFFAFDSYRANQSQSKDRPFWLQTYNGGRYIVNRKNDELGRIVPNLGLSIFGYIQKKKMEQIAAGLTPDGLLQRFIVFFGNSEGEEKDRRPDELAAREYNQLIRSLSEVEKPQTIQLEADAHVWRKKVDKAAKAIQNHPAYPEALQEHVGKWKGMFARMLLTYHVCIAAPDVDGVYPPIPASTAELVHNLFRDFLLPCAVDFYTRFFDTKSSNPDLTNARWLADYILARGLPEITLRDAKRAYEGLDDKAAQRAFTLLQQLSWVSEAESPRANSTRWAVNPMVHILWDERAAAESERRELERRKIADANRDLRDFS